MLSNKQDCPDWQWKKKLGKKKKKKNQTNLSASKRQTPQSGSNIFKGHIKQAVKIISGQRKTSSRNASSKMCFCPWFNMYNLPSGKGAQRAWCDLGTMNNGHNLPSVIMQKDLEPSKRI